MIEGGGWKRWCVDMWFCIFVLCCARPSGRLWWYVCCAYDDWKRCMNVGAVKKSGHDGDVLRNELKVAGASPSA